MIETEAEPERALVERARGGDRAAFGALVERYASALAAFAARRLDPAEEAQDVAQTTLVRALEALPGLEDPGAFRGWLYGIALNECRRRHKRTGLFRRAIEALRARPAPATTSLETHEEAEVVRAHVLALPERQRLAVELRVWEGLSCAETARALGCTEGTVKANFHHALARLRERLARKEGK